MDLFDLHCDTLSKCLESNGSLYDGDFDFNIVKTRIYNKRCQTFAAFIPDEYRGEAAFEYYKRLRNCLYDQLEKYRDYMSLCRSSNEIEKIVSDGKLAALFSAENATALGGKIENIETAILANLRMKTIEELKNLPDISEGVENKLFSAIRVATSLSKVYNNVKSKRYTLARIRRLVLSAFLGIDNSFFMQKPEYIRVLGFNKTGEEILRDCRKNSEMPIILKATEIKQLSEKAQKMFEFENRATDLYLLSLKKPQECGLEYKANLIKTEC